MTLLKSCTLSVRNKGLLAAIVPSTWLHRQLSQVDSFVGVYTLSQVDSFVGVHSLHQVDYFVRFMHTYTLLHILIKSACCPMQVDLSRVYLFYIESDHKVFLLKKILGIA